MPTVAVEPVPGMHYSNAANPKLHQAAVVQSDTDELTYYSLICVLAAGTVTVVSVGGETVAWVCPAGFVIPVFVKQVKDTGTDVANANLVAIW